MRVFVAGATGELGRAAIPHLIAAGYDVVGSARGDANAGLLRSLGAEPREVDLYDLDGLMRAVSGCDAVIRLTTKIPPLMTMRNPRAWEETNRLRTEGARLLVEAAKGAGCGTYITESITFPYADGEDAWLTEDAPVDVAGWPAFQAALASEELAQQFTAAGGKGIVLRFSSLYSNDDAVARDVRHAMQRRMYALFGSGDAYMSPLWIPDAGAAVASGFGVTAGLYNVCDDNPLRQRDYFKVLSRVWRAPGPLRLPRLLAPVLLGGVANFLLRSQRVSNERFKRLAGWMPRARTLEEGLSGGTD